MSGWIRKIGELIAGKRAVRAARRREWKALGRVWRLADPMTVERFSAAQQIVFEAAREAPPGATTLEAAIGLLGEERIAKLLAILLEEGNKRGGRNGQNGQAGTPILLEEWEPFRSFPAEAAIEVMQDFFILNPRLGTGLIAGWMASLAKGSQQNQRI